MAVASRVKVTLGTVLVAAAATWGWQVRAQGQMAPTNDAPNPYQTITNYFKLPAGRTWGSTSAVDIDKDGRTIWVAERCGANSCLDRATGQMSPLDPILHFDADGNLIKSFGAGMMIFPHGIDVDPDGNIWVTDGQDNAPTPARGAAPGGRGAAGAAAGRGAQVRQGRLGPLPGATKGHQVLKFSPQGELLMTIGKPGGAALPQCCSIRAFRCRQDSHSAGARRIATTPSRQNPPLRSRPAGYGAPNRSRRSPTPGRVCSAARLAVPVRRRRPECGVRPAEAVARSHAALGSRSDAPVWNRAPEPIKARNSFRWRAPARCAGSRARGRSTTVASRRTVRGNRPRWTRITPIYVVGHDSRQAPPDGHRDPRPGGRDAHGRPPDSI